MSGIRPGIPSRQWRVQASPYTRDELQDLFDCADDRVMRIRAGGSKGWIPADRMATIMKTAYAWGLRRNEVRSLDLVDLAVNPGARQFRQFGILYVRHGKAMRGSPPKRRSVLTVPEFDWVCDCLQQWIEDVRPRYAPTRSTDLWPSERGGMIAADSISRAFNEIRREARLDEGLDFHSLRRSYVTHMIEDAFFVQQQVGHEHDHLELHRPLPRLPQPRRFRRDQQSGHHHLGNDESMNTIADLLPHLADRGIHLSNSQVYRLIGAKPERINLTMLAAILTRLTARSKTSAP
jgi:integrase